MHRDVAKRWRSPAKCTRLTGPRRLQLETLEDRQFLTANSGDVADLKELRSSSNLAAALVDDSYEQNDTFTTAKNLGTISTSQTLNNLVMADANDWYRFTISKAAAATGSVSPIMVFL